MHTLRTAALKAVFKSIANVYSHSSNSVRRDSSEDDEIEMKADEAK
jgi:hypothetical protein